MNSPLSPSAVAQPPIFTPHDFRKALGQFATGVTIVTALDALGQPVGVTVSSFNSVSLHPPLVLWSMANSAASLPVFMAGTHYAVHVLGAEQKELAMRFATKGIDRWAGVAHQPGHSGVPLLDGAVATFECFNRSRYQEGDHVIFVGEVERCGYRNEAAPLIYHDGRMR
ncbi:flavin reductase family protein [Comamonas endophytica]|uniref:Flavin reductase family protein n=1 Tax=Comamonas endophytica TaxID=2949090 RepID=A0ABY6GDJ6_9BURK|nr:flavin reductase family protein [Acidovorax sp. 5MLIR]MCD2512474.1 flavin reductase family protein [Acidovorax sp. D4N7]UYG53157.1 flavin reductase family protein [Acidovorax sp. 5MLIR]